MPAPIIVVHNKPDIRELAVSALCAAGLPAVGFDSPLKALAAIEANSRARVLVTRVNFGPGNLNGAALVMMLKYKLAAIKAVFLAREENRIYVDGAGEFLPLPLKPPVLVDTVARLLRVKAF